MSKVFLLFITLVVLVLFISVIIHIEELGAIYLALVVFCIFPLLALAWCVTISDGRDIN
jgi:hypothetical protein